MRLAETEEAVRIAERGNKILCRRAKPRIAHIKATCQATMKECHDATGLAFRALDLCAAGNSYALTAAIAARTEIEFWQIVEIPDAERTDYVTRMDYITMFTYVGAGLLGLILILRVVASFVTTPTETAPQQESLAPGRAEPAMPEPVTEEAASSPDDRSQDDTTPVFVAILIAAALIGLAASLIGLLVYASYGS